MLCATWTIEHRFCFSLFGSKRSLFPFSVRRGYSHTELWVRVYPDDIAVHTHEKILTDREVVAGELYWTELVVAEHLRDERDHRRARRLASPG